VVALLGLVVGASPVQASSANPFNGVWTAIDSYDGSVEYLTISGDTRVAVQYVDTFGSICVGMGSPVTELHAEAIGTVAGNALNVVYTTSHCGPVRLWWWHGGTTTFTYDPSTDRIFDGTDYYSRA
jgi:hypothetical protein